MSNQKVGLVSYGISAPYYRLAVDEIIELWMNSSLDTIKVSQGVLERGVLSQDEDGNTLAVAAVKESFKRMGDTGKVQALYYGTCTNPYDSRPSSTMILEALGLPYRTKCCDLQFSMKSGTAALIHAAAMVQAGLAQQAVAIGADTVNRHTAPGDLVEPYASAAAGALVVGTQDLAATIDGMESYSSDLSDGFRVEGERYLRTGMLLGSAKNEVGLDAHTKVAVEALLQKLDAKLSDFHYVVFQQNTPGTARHCAKLLGAADSQYKPAIYADRLGDTGSAAPFVGLAKVLDQAKAGERILLCAYGYGAGADAIALTVTPELEKIRAGARSVDQWLERKEMVDYKKAMKLEYKYLRHSYPLNAYL